MSLSQLSVLLVDGEADFAEAVKIILEHDGQMTVTNTASAQEGMAKVAEGTFDVVVSAYEMPGMNGIEFLNALRGRGEDIPFIIFTNKGNEEVAMRALNEGAAFYLRKGGEPQSVFPELAHKIRRCVERHEAEKDVQESENRLRRAEEVAGSGNWVIWLRKGIIVGSPGALALYGIDRRAIPLDVAQKMVLPEYRPLLDKALKELIEGATPYDIQFKIRRANDGRILDVHSRAEYDPEQRAVFGVVHDITAQVKALESVQEARAKLQIAMELAKLVPWEYDLATDTFAFDDQFFRLFATTTEREGGGRMSSSDYASRFLPPEDRGVVGREIAAAMASTDPDYSSRIEHEIVRRDGERRTLDVLIRVTLGPSGRPVSGYGVVQDVTERKNVQRRLHRAMTKLELLTSITRHDFGNQIQILTANLELLRRHLADPKDLSRLAKMEAATDEIKKRFQFMKEYQPDNDAPVWHDLEMLFQKLPVAKSVDDLVLGEWIRNLEIEADPMLNIVFHNLLEDSIKYAEKPIRVKIDAEERGDDLLLVYTDIGPGIAPESKEEIFVKSENRKHLGLFLCRHVLLESDISIREVGIPGKGVRFEMLVPKGQYRNTV